VAGSCSTSSPTWWDLHRFRRIGDQARDPGRADSERLALLREAVALWRREPLAGVSGAWADRTRDGSRQAYLATVVAWAYAESRAGNADTVIAPLTDLVGEHPLAEPLVGGLMLALHVAGHTAAALECYTRLRGRLRDDLGIEPGAELRRTHLETLRRDQPSRMPVPASWTAA
jgi:two-component SAPR family response regulator